MCIEAQATTHTTEATYTADGRSPPVVVDLKNDSKPTIAACNKVKVGTSGGGLQPTIAPLEHQCAQQSAQGHVEKTSVPFRNIGR